MLRFWVRASGFPSPAVQTGSRTNTASSPTRTGVFSPGGTTTGAPSCPRSPPNAVGMNGAVTPLHYWSSWRTQSLYTFRSSLAFRTSVVQQRHTATAEQCSLAAGSPPSQTKHHNCVHSTSSYLPAYGRRTQGRTHRGGGGCWAASPQNPKNQNLKHLVDIMTSKVLRGLPFSRNQPPKSADDKHSIISKNKLIQLKKQDDRTL
jgi:hypothetical protein